MWLAAAALAFGLASTACGDVRFVDPDRDLKTSLKITRAERLFIPGDPRAYFHIRIASRRGLDLIDLTVSGRSGTSRLPLQGAHVQNCGDVETCISITMPPGPPEDADRIALEAPTLGHRHDWSVETVHLEGYLLSGTALSGNARVAVTIDDPIRRRYGNSEVVRTLDANGDVEEEFLITLFPRSFDIHNASGSCGVPPAGTVSGWGLARGNPFEHDAMFSPGDAPETCTSIRPTLPAGGAGVAGLTIPARALLERFQHIYVPAVELSPLVFVPIFDLEIPNVERCATAQELVRSAVRATADFIASSELGAEVLMLDSVQLATEDGSLCHQSNLRSFEPSSLASEITTRVDEHFGLDRRVRVVLIYSSNLNLDLPFELRLEFQLLRNLLRANAPDRGEMMVAIAPSRPIAGLEPERAMEWVATEEPTFAEDISTLFVSVWPFRTLVHTPDTVVPLTTAEDRTRFVSYRVCSASEAVRPVGTRRPSGTDVFDVSELGPAYQVDLMEQVLVDSGSFFLPSITVDWEACTGLCDHAAPDGAPGVPWNQTFGCL